ncbi:MAG: acyl-CoA thioesterase [Bdellovibrionia bacterium]
MNLYFRFFWLFFKSLFYKNELTLLDTCTTSFRVNPLDLDINLHMNNGRYLSLMDLGRTDLMFRAKVFKKLFFKGYYPVVISESISFRKSLNLFDSFVIETKLDAWNEKDFYLLQTFKFQNEVIAEGFIKGRFLKRGVRGSVPTAELFQILNLNLPLTKPSALSEAQNQTDSLLAPRKKTATAPQA